MGCDERIDVMNKTRSNYVADRLKEYITNDTLITPNDLAFLKDLRRRLDKLKPGTHMLLDINSARYLTEFIGTPLYRSRNATYVSFVPWQIEKWLTLAEQKVARAVASKFDLA